MGTQDGITPSAEFIEIKAEIETVIHEVKDLKNTVHNLEKKVENDLRSMENTVGSMENTVNRRIGNLWWQVGLGLIAGFYLILHVFDDKLDFMNEQYSDRFGRMEAGISISSPDVLVLIDKIKKDYENKLASQKDKSKPLKPKKKK